MSRAKDNWYVIVMTQVGPKFVTHVNWRDNIAEWNGEARPYRFDNKADAQEIARGLTFNVSPAYAICQAWEITEQPFQYGAGKFMWVTGPEQS